jgi:hypothetical protein
MIDWELGNNLLCSAIEICKAGLWFRIDFNLDPDTDLEPAKSVYGSKLNLTF